MRMFKFEMRTAMVYTDEMCPAVADAVRNIGGGKVFVATDPGVARRARYQELLSGLKAAGIPYEECRDVEIEPGTKSIDALAAKLRASACSAIIAFGGGSTIDTSKAAAIIASNGGAARDYFGVGQVPKAPLPVIAIPTTAGSGADMTCFVAIVDEQRQTKAQILDEKAAPLVSILCPDNLAGIPQKLVPAVGFDSLTHAAEGYINARANAVTEALSIQAFTLMSRNLLKFYEDTTNRDAAGELLLATSLGCLACNTIGTGNAHCIARSIGGRFHGIPHGVALAVILPHVLNFNLPVSFRKMSKLAEAMGVAAGKDEMANAQTLVLAIQKLRDDLRLPDNYRELGVDLTELDRLAAESKDKSMHGSSAGAPPREASLEDYRKLITDAYNGVRIVYS